MKLVLPVDMLAKRRNNTMARKDALSSLRAILIRRRDALRNALNGDLTLLKELRSESPGDVIDAAVDTAQDEISSQLAEVEARELGSIENALERMDSGAYGACEVCSGKNTPRTASGTPLCHNVYPVSARNRRIWWTLGGRTAGRSLVTSFPKYRRLSYFVVFAMYTLKGICMQSGDRA